MNDLLIRACCFGAGLLNSTRGQAAAFAFRIRNHEILKSWPIRLLGWLMAQLLILVASLFMGFIFLVISEYLKSDGAIFAGQVP